MFGFGPGGREQLHYPDLLLRTPDGKRIAIELELTGKGRTRREKILSGYGADRKIDAVVYLVSRPEVGRSVAAAARKLGLSELVHVQSFVWTPLDGQARAPSGCRRGSGSGAPDRHLRTDGQNGGDRPLKAAHPPAPRRPYWALLALITLLLLPTGTADAVLAGAVAVTGAVSLIRAVRVDRRRAARGTTRQRARARRRYGRRAGGLARSATRRSWADPRCQRRGQVDNPAGDPERPPPAGAAGRGYRHEGLARLRPQPGAGGRGRRTRVSPVDSRRPGKLESAPAWQSDRAEGQADLDRALHRAALPARRRALCPAGAAGTA